VPDSERPLLKANIDRLKLLFRECSGDVKTLVELRDELLRRRTPAAKELLKLVEAELGALDGMQARLINRETPAAESPHGSDRDAAETSKPRVLSSRENAARKRIAELRMRLLDLTNSNRLLNYKFGSRSRRQVRLVDELPDQILAKLQEGKRLIFKSLPEPPDEPTDEKDDVFILAVEQAMRSDEEYLDALRSLGNDEEGDATRRIDRALRDRVRATLNMRARRARDEISKSKWAAQNGIDSSFDLPSPAAPKEAYLDGDIQTLLLPDEMERILSAIHDQARSTLQETGNPTLYLALGFLEWFEAANSQVPLFAPLLLHPVELERTIVSGKYRYSLRSSPGEEPTLNITLSERLYQDFHRRLPAFE
jgi:hypothetical protein